MNAGMFRTESQHQDLFRNLLAKCLNNRQVAVRLFKKFRLGLPEYFECIPENFDESNLLDLKSAAHKLKGAAATLGVDSLAATAKRIDDAAKQNDFETAAFAFGDMQNEISEFLQWANGIEDVEEQFLMGACSN